MVDNYFQLEGVVRGHHIYKNVWTPAIGEHLSLQQEPDNSYDSFAVTVMKEGDVVGRVPRELSYSFTSFIQSVKKIQRRYVSMRYTKLNVDLFISLKEKLSQP